MFNKGHSYVRESPTRNTLCLIVTILLGRILTINCAPCKQSNTTMAYCIYPPVTSFNTICTLKQMSILDNGQCKITLYNNINTREWTH